MVHLAIYRRYKRVWHWCFAHTHRSTYIFLYRLHIWQTSCKQDTGSSARACFITHKRGFCLLNRYPPGDALPLPKLSDLVSIRKNPMFCGGCAQCCTALHLEIYLISTPSSRSCRRWRLAFSGSGEGNRGGKGLLCYAPCGCGGWVQRSPLKKRECC